MKNGFKKSKNLVWSIALRIYHFKHSLFFEWIEILKSVVGINGLYNMQMKHNIAFKKVHTIYQNIHI